MKIRAFLFTVLFINLITPSITQYAVNKTLIASKLVQADVVDNQEHTDRNLNAGAFIVADNNKQRQISDYEHVLLGEQINISMDTSTVDAPKPVYQVFPVYPYELRRKGVRGVVKLRLLIDKSGLVRNVDVIKSIHPYLDYVAARAFRQWKFEPVQKNGKAFPVSSIFVFDFSPEKYTLIDRSVSASERAREEMDFPDRDKLRRLLDDCAEYCRKLDGSALDFVCEENIQETQQYLHPVEKPKLISQKKEARGRSLDGTAWYYGIFSKFRAKYTIRPMRNRYLCDYQLIKTGDRIEERRILLRDGRKRTSSPMQRLEETRFSVLKPLFAAVQIIGWNSQEMFDYSVVDEDKIGGSKAYIIEAVPLYRNIGSVEKARIWVSKQNSQILKVVINGVPLEGYDDVWRDATMLAIKPESTITHIYKSERNGVMFPSQSSVLIEYPAIGPQEPIEKVKLVMRYDKYKYFTVETEHEIIKK